MSARNMNSFESRAHHKDINMCTYATDATFVNDQFVIAIINIISIIIIIIIQL